MPQVITKSQEQRTRILSGISNNLASWFIKVRKIKAIYHTLNMFNVEQKNFIAEGWCPVDQLDTIRGALHKASVGILPVLKINVLKNYLKKKNKQKKITHDLEIHFGLT